ncbi:hypothetical protein CERSUDRAFT_120074 [Gelatoporia subvermispora B]|uniref:Uncharacterized protein n=1 Tax=Ceriporiopsis subvermispora (strain B) TaxID=914234 RepID=M2QX47_CERS8|nr:hypothetical protein CERSUDRAFT_120074 [Gelatoporia subvermispora B]
MRSLLFLSVIAGLFVAARADEVRDLRTNLSVIETDGRLMQQPAEVWTSYGTYTATRVYESLVATSPWLLDETTLVVWTVAETMTAQPEPTAPAPVPRAHARDFTE